MVKVVHHQITWNTVKCGLNVADCEEYTQDISKVTCPRCEMAKQRLK